VYVHLRQLLRRNHTENGAFYLSALETIMRKLPCSKNVTELFGEQDEQSPKWHPDNVYHTSANRSPPPPVRHYKKPLDPDAARVDRELHVRHRSYNQKRIARLYGNPPAPRMKFTIRDGKVLQVPFEER
ncbi:hypothetical protein CYMTET_28569, partial [Cymbomonas tetramitiformis]